MLTRRSPGLALILVAVAALAVGCPKPPPEPVDTTPVEPPPREAPPPQDTTPRIEDEGFQTPEPVEVPSEQGLISEGQALPGLNTVYFAFDRYDLSEDTLRTLKDNATTILANPDWPPVRVEGHCDERGTIEYNLELGAKRARAVVDYLVSLGVPVDRLDLRSYGEEKPVDLGKSEAAYSRNRRAEFVAGG